MRRGPGMRGVPCRMYGFGTETETTEEEIERRLIGAIEHRSEAIEKKKNSKG